ncbi:MAG TPA: RluA family pseudouridine synthase [Candidatus Polarisedimenticolia bacterium]|jgi:23S rRNA pseudouridine1911/1915/1917 synthase|nr:RluA family pseudouridine synthase [Candidatus Polarisedimenticolia bacterium]
MPPRTRARAGRRHLTLDLPAESRGQRLDRTLAERLPGESRAALQRLMRGGRVLVAGRPARPSDRVRGGERVEIDRPAPVPSALAAEDLPLTILHEDADLLVLDKPPGQTVHPGAGSRGGTVVNALLHHCRDLSGVGGVERPGIVHRLDKDTSGVLAVAKNDLAHRALAAQFKAREVEKVYEALVWGRPSAGRGVVDSAIGRHPTARTRMTVRPDGRPSRTAYRVLYTRGPVSFLEIRPETGRTHQIRVHLSSMSHPVVGDRLYGGRRDPNRAGPPFGEILRSYAGLALHARRLAFTHPRTGERLAFEAPRPRELQALLDRLERLPGPAAAGASR